jgi:hypothetical protein
MELEGIEAIINGIMEGLKENDVADFKAFSSCSTYTNYEDYQFLPREI